MADLVLAGIIGDKFMKILKLSSKKLKINCIVRRLKCRNFPQGLIELSRIGLGFWSNKENSRAQLEHVLILIGPKSSLIY